MAQKPKSLIPLGPSPTRKTIDSMATEQWFTTASSQLQVLKTTTAPTAAQIPDGRWAVCWETTGGTVKIYANKGGTIVASAAFT